MNIIIRLFTIICNNILEDADFSLKLWMDLSESYILLAR